MVKFKYTIYLSPPPPSGKNKHPTIKILSYVLELLQLNIILNIVMIYLVLILIKVLTIKLLMENLSNFIFIKNTIR